jgi:flagellar hook-associated protein 2
MNTMAIVSAASSTAGTLSTPGLGSGLDVQSLVAKLMAVEQKPLSLLDTQEAKFQTKLTSLGSITGALSSLQSAAKTLASASSVQYSAAESDSSVLTAATASDALPGKYSVKVNTLAQAQSLLAVGKSSTTAAIGGGSDTTLTFTFGTITGTADPITGMYPNATFVASTVKASGSVAIGSSNNTLAGIRDVINAGNFGVTANIVNDGSLSPYRLTITSNDTGAANSLSISVSGDSEIGSLLGYEFPITAAPQNLQQTQGARNADLTIDGVNITSASNTITGAIQGITLNLAKETATNSPVSVTVQRDSSGLVSALSGLVKAYNTAHASITGATAKGAVLQGDGGVLGLKRQIAAILGSAQSTSGAYTTLSSLGIGFSKDGALVFDTAKANVALATDPTGVAALTATIGNAIDNAATSLLGAAGPISSKKDGISRSIKDIGSRRTNLQHRIELLQQRYQKQFGALDSLLSSMNQTSTFLTSQLDSITNMLKK